MKKIIKLFSYLLVLTFTFNALAFFGLFEKKVDPMSLKTYEERMDYLLNHDPVFKKYWSERKSKIQENYDANIKELKKIEEEIEETGKYSPEAIKQMNAENEKRQKLLFEQRMKEMETQLLNEWAIVDGEFVNLKDYNEKKAKEKADQEELRRIQQFQSEEGLPISKKMEDVRINVD